MMNYPGSRCVAPFSPALLSSCHVVTQPCSCFVPVGLPGVSTQFDWLTRALDHSPTTTTTQHPPLRPRRLAPQHQVVQLLPGHGPGRAEPGKSPHFARARSLCLSAIYTCVCVCTIKMHALRHVLEVTRTRQQQQHRTIESKFSPPPSLALPPPPRRCCS
jgi:hypothetical protein